MNGKTGAVTLGASDVGAYVKPSTGIQKSDLAQAVQTSLDKADTALQQHQSLSGYATESYVQTQIAAIPDELPVVSASDNGKVLGVVDGAWAVKSDEGGGGGSAPFEIPITQSGSTYSTTATAADILANKDDCAIALSSGAIRIPLDYYTVSGNSTLLFFGTTSLVDNPPHIVNFLVQVSGNTVSVSQAEYTIRSVPAVTASDNGKSLVVENGAWGKGYQAARTPRVAMTASDTTPTLDPNKLYVFPEMATLTPTLASPTDNTIVNEYHFVFDSGSTATVLTLPASVLQPDGFTVEANMHYEVSILEGAMTAQGWAVSGS